MKRTFLFTIFFSFFFLIANWGFSQTSISGVVNSYAAVDSIYPTKDTVEVSNPAAFHANDTVMIYQVKGAESEKDTTSNIHLFGTIRNLGDANNAGKYEIIIVEEIKGDTVIFKVSLNNTYNTDDLVQLIRVPSFENVIVDSELTCDNWDGTTGGVLALMVSNTLFLNSDINVTGKGFRGSTPFESSGDCAEMDSVLYKSQYFNESAITVSAGFKGEGVTKFDPVYRKGLGRWANGGGGGNARFSGGGGGGNSGKGGFGGEEDTIICSNPNYGGYWNSHGGSDGYGLGDLGFFSDNTIFFGGGGGAGTFTSGLSASSGGNGGGIVIIIAKVIKSSGDYNIIADGESVTDSVDASGGGGGAGGTVAFDVDSVIGDLNIFFKGGDGGWVKTYGASGPGGGGGGGAILYNRAKINDDFTGNGGRGKAGSSEDMGYGYPHKAFGGLISNTLISNVKMPLTGFLFNSITSNQVVCWNSTPKILSGSILRGGDGTYAKQWRDSPDGEVWTDIPGAINNDYQPPALTDKKYYRRVVTSGIIIDSGNDIEIIVQDTIDQNNISGFDLVKCIGNEADIIIGDTASSGGDENSYNYIWEYSFDATNWITETGTEDTLYNHGIVTDTTFVRRIVISGACYDTAMLVNPIIGLPKIKNWISSDTTEYCDGDSIHEFKSDTLLNGLGAGSYTFKWLNSLDEINWTDTISVIDSVYHPSVLYDTTYYKRVVSSDDCTDTSNTISIDVFPIIGNNIIDNSSPAFACFDSVPGEIIALFPTGGNNNYSYQWQDSTKGVNGINILLDDTLQNYSPKKIIAPTFYRRIVESGEIGACKDTTDFVEIGIRNLPDGSLINFKDTICSGLDFELNFALVNTGTFPLTITYTNGFDPPFNTIVPDYIDMVNITLNPITTNTNQEFIYSIVSIEDNNGCLDTTLVGVATAIVFGNPIANPGFNDTICSLNYQLAAQPSVGAGFWSQISGEGNTDFEDITKATSDISVDTVGVYTYVWKEINGECEESNEVEITLYEDISNIKIRAIDDVPVNTDTSILYLYNITKIELQGLFDGSIDYDIITKSLWEFGENVLTSQGNEIRNQIIYDDPNDSTIVTLRSLENEVGVKYIPVIWTVRKGVCPSKETIIEISLDREPFQPTGFTPNGDGVNDKLMFYGIESYINKTKTLIIYNRWGTEVYNEDYDIISGWDGTNGSGNNLPDDTYFYVLLITDYPSETLKGSIVIKRY
ncbi:MAG: T9SS type B sorting domain-containing protein [Bacteroidales bacterium]|nr:T9SS type B sorting domain-containing protein [Bacteroidales bacterium]